MLLLDWQYTTDKVGNPLAIADGVDPSKSKSYGCQDHGYFLTSGNGPWGSHSWTYAKVGDRPSETRDGITSSYRYGTNDASGRNRRLAEVTRPLPASAERFFFDDAGNQIWRAEGNEKERLRYDEDDRLASITIDAPSHPTEVSTMIYDGRGFLARAELSPAPGQPWQRFTEATYSSEGVLQQRRSVSRIGINTIRNTPTVDESATILYFWASPIRVGSQGIGVEVETAEVEEDGGTESISVSEATGLGLDLLNLGVEALGGGVGGGEQNGVEDSPEVFSDGSRGLSDGFEPGAQSAGDPELPRLFGPEAGAIAPEAVGGFFERPGPGGLEGRTDEPVESAPDVGLELASAIRAHQPVVLGASELFAALAAKLAMLHLAHVVDSLVDAGGDMEAVEGDLGRSIGDRGDGGIDVGLPHVHGDAFNGLSLNSGKAFIEGGKAVGLALVGDKEHPRSGEIGDDRDVLVALLKGGLVDADPARVDRFPTLEATSHGALLNGVHRAPAQVQPARHGPQRRMVEPVDDQGLEQGREARARIGPRQANLANAVLTTLDARNVGSQDRAKLASIQMSPSARLVIVDGAIRTALRARRASSGLEDQSDLNLLLIKPQLDVSHSPGRFDPQNPRIQVSVSHTLESTAPTHSNP